MVSQLGRLPYLLTQPYLTTGLTLGLDLGGCFITPCRAGRFWTWQQFLTGAGGGTMLVFTPHFHCTSLGPNISHFIQTLFTHCVGLARGRGKEGEGGNVYMTLWSGIHLLGVRLGGGDSF